MMRKHSTSFKGSSENNLGHVGATSLCKVHQSSMVRPESKQRPGYDDEISGEDFSNSMPPLGFIEPTAQSSTSKQKVVEQPAMTPLPEHPVKGLSELDIFSSGDYLELLDLDIPESPSSSWNNWSCVTIGSDECCDYLDLQDLETENSCNDQLGTKNSELSVPDSSKTDSVFVQAASSAVPLEMKFLKRTRDDRAIFQSSIPLNSQCSEVMSDGHQTQTPDGRKNTDGTQKRLKRKEEVPSLHAI